MSRSSLTIAALALYVFAGIPQISQGLAVDASKWKYHDPRYARGRIKYLAAVDEFAEKVKPLWGQERGRAKNKFLPELCREVSGKPNQIKVDVFYVGPDKERPGRWKVVLTNNLGDVGWVDSPAFNIPPERVIGSGPGFYWIRGQFANRVNGSNSWRYFDFYPSAFYERVKGYEATEKIEPMYPDLKMTMRVDWLVKADTGEAE